MTPATDNAARVERGRLALAAYAAAIRSTASDAGDFADDASDLLADVLHAIAAQEGPKRCEELHARAWRHYVAERWEEERPS